MLKGWLVRIGGAGGKDGPVSGRAVPEVPGTDDVDMVVGTLVVA